MTESAPAPADPWRLGVLSAFPYMDARTVAVLREHAGATDFFLDSGAFTAWRSGKPISLDDYCRFLDKCPVKTWRYVMLDVIENPGATLDNLRAMRSRGFKPVPVFTPGQALDDLAEYYAEDSDFIACGGLANKYSPASESWLARVRRAATAARPDGKLHLLGYTSLQWVKYHRPFSCDSSTWVNGARYGAIHLWMGNGTFRIITKSSVQTKPLKPEFAQAIASLGVDPYALRRLASWSGTDPAVNLAYRINIRSWIAACVKTRRAIGTRIFLAGARDPLGMLLKEHRLMRERIGA